MPIRRPALRALMLSAGLGLAGCAAQITPPPPPPRHAAVPPPPHRAPAPPDWFHRQLALARRARATHLPQADSAGAQRAYFAVMVPACGKIAASGPAKYQARCKAIVDRASTDAAAADAGPPCDEDRDDSGDSPAQITACSD